MGLGAVLSQEQGDGSQRPIAFASQTLQTHEKNYGVTELEALAVVWAVKHFRAYIYGNHCTIYTDHQALRCLLNTPQPSGKLARWGMAFQELDLTILYRPGRVNEKADALSRHPSSGDDSIETDTPSVMIATTSQQLPPSTLAENQRKDTTLLPIIRYMEDGVLPESEKEAKAIVLGQSNFALIYGVLFHVESDKTLRVIPPIIERKELWQQLHSGSYGGHLKCAKLHGQLAKHYWWPRMRTDVMNWCRSCLVCATRGTGKNIKVPLTPIPVHGPFDRVGGGCVKVA